MKKIFLLYIAALLIISSFLYPACKKVTHPLNPTPGNYRMQSYTKVTYDLLGGTTNDNYTFYYDGSGRVSQILFTSNDSSADGAEFTSSTFSYTGDTIIKKTTQVNTATVLETDTFVTNPQGLIAYVFTPGFQATYQYFGKLLAIQTETYIGDSGTSIAASTMDYTSSNGDLLQRTFAGNALTLTANWADTGRNAALNPPDVQFVPPFTVSWTSYATATTHKNVSGFSDVLNGYTGGGPIIVSVIDANGAINRDTCTFPEDLSLTQNYAVYPDQLNRTGDYLQLESFTMYGSNIYQNNHLIKTINNPSDTTNVVYTIDGDSKITQTSVSYRYAHVPYGPASVIYKIQYETY